MQRYSEEKFMYVLCISTVHWSVFAFVLQEVDKWGREVKREQP